MRTFHITRELLETRPKTFEARCFLLNVNKAVDYLQAIGYDARMPPALDDVFAALANEHRREIVRRLARGALTTPEVALHFGFTKQAMSRHLGLLEEAGLVRRTLRGRVHELHLVPKPLEGVARWVSELRRGWVASLDRLDEVLHG